MAWIESHQELAQHPKTKRLMRLLGLSQYEAIGALHMLWWWAMEYAQDGDLSDYSDEDIADAINWPKDAAELVDALVSSKFIDADRCLHDWHAYAGKLIERRRIDAERKRRSDGSPPDVRPTSNGRRAESGSNRNPNRTSTPTVPETTPTREPEGGPGGVGGESGTEHAAGAAAAPPDGLPSGRIRAAPKPSGSGPPLAPLFEAFAAVGLPRPAMLGRDPPAAQELLRHYPAEQIAACWQDYASGVYGSPVDHGNLSFGYLANNNRVGNWMNWKQGSLVNGTASKPRGSSRAKHH